MTETVDDKKKLSEYGVEFDAEFLKGKGYTSDSELSQSDFDGIFKDYEEFKKANSSEKDAPANEPKAPAEEQPQEKESAEEKKEEVQLVPHEDEIEVNQEDWVVEYDHIMSEYAKSQDKEWKREFKDEDGNDVKGLKGHIDDAEVHFTAPDKVKANLAGIEALVNLAKEKGLDVAYNEEWSDEFKTKMAEVCEKQGVILQGLPKALENKEEERLALPEHLEEQTAENEAPIALPEHLEQTAENEAESTKPEHKYKITPKIANGNLTMYALKARTNKEFEAEVAKQEQQLASGFYDVTGSDKVKAELLMKKYAIAMNKDDKEMAENCVTALQCYGAERIDRVPDQAEGKYTVVEGKPYAERTDEEKARIDQAMAKALPGLNKTEEKGKDNTKAPMVAKQNTYE